MSEVRYAKSGDFHIAYATRGEGPIDLVVEPGWILPFEVLDELPEWTRFAERLTAFAREIVFDKRGIGMSDRMSRIPTLEERMDDIRVVMDGVGSDRAVLFGNYDAAAVCALFAATYPERVRALVLYAPAATLMADDDHPWGFTSEVLEETIELIESIWGTGGLATISNQSRLNDPEFREWAAKAERVGATPGSAAAFMRTIAGVDIRPVLPTISVPTLVITRDSMPTAPAHASRYVADRIPGARYVELPGSDILPFLGDSDEIADEIEEFVTGTRPQRVPERVLATVLFTDFVDSTATATNLGDFRWKELLDRHDALVERQLNRFRGRLIKTTGDGILASFDGPARAIQAACTIREAVAGLGIQMRSGLHTGEIEIRGDDIGGIAVNIGARVAALAEPQEVLVTRTLVDLVAGSGIEFIDRGERSLKGVPGEWRLFSVQGTP